MSTFSKNLKYLREKKNLTQLEFAEAIGRKSISTISEWEKGLYSPKIGVVSDIAKFFDVSLSDITEKDLTNKNWIVDSFLEFDTEKFKAELSENPNLIGVVKGIVNNYDDDDFQIPLFSSVSCGNIQSIDNILIDTVSVPNRLKKRYGSDVFAVRARGDSMNNVILDRHIAVFAKTEWQNGDAVIVMLNKEEATLKRITKTNYAILLEPDSTNKEHKPVFIDCVGNDCEVEVIGKLVHTYCDFE